MATFNQGMTYEALRKLGYEAVDLYENCDPIDTPIGGPLLMEVKYGCAMCHLWINPDGTVSGATVKSILEARQPWLRKTSS